MRFSSTKAQRPRQECINAEITGRIAFSQLESTAVAASSLSFASGYDMSLFFVHFHSL